MLYAKIVDNRITDYRDFPADWDPASVAHKFDWRLVENLPPNGDADNIVYESGRTILPGKVVADYSIRQITRDEIESKRAWAITKIDSEAAGVHKKIIDADDFIYTALYEEKAKELRLYDELVRAGGDPEKETASFPFLSSSLGVYGKTISEAAEIVRYKRGEWIAACTAVERARLAAKIAVRSAATVAEINAAMTVDWGI